MQRNKDISKIGFAAFTPEYCKRRTVDNILHTRRPDRGEGWIPIGEGRAGITPLEGLHQRKARLLKGKER
jgi:hypothetical protein